MRHKAEIKVLVLNCGDTGVVVGGDLNTFKFQKEDFREVNVVQRVCDVHLVR